jgi:hypothetical protein
VTEPLLLDFTSPAPPAPPPVGEAEAAPPPVAFPLSWLLEQDAPALHYRAFTDVARVPDAERQTEGLPLASRQAQLLALQQHPDGRWNERMLTIPGPRAESFEGVGTIPAVQRLLEYGFRQDSPPVMHARRLLFRLLAEDTDPAMLHELGGKSVDEEMARRGRGVLREAAAATLAQAGFEADPRLRGAARRIIERIDAYLDSPLAEKPWVRVGNKQVLAPEAYPPSFYSLRMLAYMPLLRHEYYAAINRIYESIAHPLPRQEPAQLVGKKIVAQPHLVLGDRLPHRNAVDSDVPFALVWLETMARLNFLKRNENWQKLFERFLEDRDQRGVWHPHKGFEMPHTRDLFAWPAFPLADTLADETRWADVTFRIGLIARLAGREIEIV